MPADPADPPPSPAISVVLPSYECPDLFSRSLMSALTQRGVSTEVIVTDDSKTTAVRDIVQALQPLYPQLQYAPGPRTGNPVDNWNAGLERVRAPYAVVLHHDEFLLDPDYLARAVDRLEGAPDAPMLVTRVQVISPKAWSWFALVSRLAAALNLPVWTLHLANWIGPTAAVVFRMSDQRRFDRRLVWKVDTCFYVATIGDSALFMRDKNLCILSTQHEGQITNGIDSAAANINELTLISYETTTHRWQIKIALYYARLKKIIPI